MNVVVTPGTIYYDPIRPEYSLYGKSYYYYGKVYYGMHTFKIVIFSTEMKLKNSIINLWYSGILILEE